MTTRVRFAPSPTGYLHIGGARTALYNYLFAKASKGKFILRVEDTDRERSKSEYEESQLNDLEWLGIVCDEGPRKDGAFGPYRQSERTEIYQTQAQKLIEQKKAFYCFCSNASLEAKKEKAMAENKDPIYDGACRNLSKSEIEAKKAEGIQATVRFEVPKKEFSFSDQVRGVVTFPEGMVGDFIILRSDKTPVYNFCCVVDDIAMKINPVIRAEDHLNNTLRQIMLYDAFGEARPDFAHVSLLIGSDRQKLSKRHGATALDNYRKEHFLPQAVCNYLLLLGWSHPEEKDIFTMDEVIPHFHELKRFNKAPAMFDVEKFKYVNGQHLNLLGPNELRSYIDPVLNQNVDYKNASETWKNGFAELYKEKVNLAGDYIPFIVDIFGQDIQRSDDLDEILGWETTAQIAKYFDDELSNIDCDFLTEDDFNKYSGFIKKELKIKGKPLFMGMRGVLTGKGHGSDLGKVFALTPVEVLKKRLKQIIQLLG